MNAADTPTRPNILLMLVDDMGYSDLGCYGSEIHTPNLDRLAAGGVRFSQFYNAARCCPSRASLLTGVYPHQAGVGHMVQNRGVPAYQGYLRDDCVTTGEVLREAGYFTGYAGKWHTGGFWKRTPEAIAKWRFDDPTHPLPIHRGFDRFYGNPAGGGSYWNIALAEQDRLIELPENFYTTDNYTDAALDMIGEATMDNRPWFVHLCYNAPHWPLHAWEEDIETYRGRYQPGGWDAIRTARHEEMKGLGILDSRWPISPRDESAPAWTDAPHHEWEDARMATYAAMVDRIDQNVGRIIQRLKDLGQLNNTIIVFLADNGGSAEFLRENGHAERELPFTRDGRPVRTGNIVGMEPGGPETFMSYDLPWANASNSPFRLFKCWVHEGGISTPMIVHGPGIAGGGRIVHQMTHLVDLVATLYDATGAQYPESRGDQAVTPLEGESFLPLLRGEDWRREQPLFWEHQGNCAARDGQWKLVRQHKQDWELYDMDKDRTELNNLAEREPERVKAMAAEWRHWADRCGVLSPEELAAIGR